MKISRRAALQTLGFAAAAAPLSVSAQGRCMLTFGSPACNTAAVTPAFEPTGWKTTALDHITPEREPAEARQQRAADARNHSYRSRCTVMRATGNCQP